MDLGLAGKVALVTGGSRGIGSYVAAALGREGCRVAICGRTRETLDAKAGELADAGIDVLPVEVDITDRSGAARLVDAVVDHWGRVDVLVNNVGGNRRKPFDETTDDDWDAILDVNLTAHARVSRAAIPGMKERGEGAIVFISSIFGREAGGKGLVLYNTTKSAVISLAKIMALELAGDGIRVLSVAPGSIRFPGGSWDRRCIEQPEAMQEFIAQNIPLGRFGTAQEVADVVAFLASPRASLVTGACVNVDGGQSKSLI